MVCTQQQQQQQQQQCDDSMDILMHCVYTAAATAAVRRFDGYLDNIRRDFDLLLFLHAIFHDSYVVVFRQLYS